MVWYCSQQLKNVLIFSVPITYWFASCNNWSTAYCTCDLIYQLYTEIVLVSWLIVSPGTEGTDSGLASVLNSLEFCLKPCGSEASILEDLSKAINLVHTRRNLVENDRVLLNRADRAQQEYERYIIFCFFLCFLTGAIYWIQSGTDSMQRRYLLYRIFYSIYFSQNPLFHLIISQINVFPS